MIQRLMSPTDALREEHRVILRALVLLEAAVAHLSDGRAVPVGWWEQLIDWLRAFADRNHHGKEEQHLFPALTAAGVPSEGGPVGVMLEEHGAGRTLIETMSAPDLEARVQAARRYVQLLRNHIGKENLVLLPLADAVLDTQAQLRVASGFEHVEIEHGPDASVERAEALVDRLAAALAE